MSANIGTRTGNLVGATASVYKGTEKSTDTGTTHTGTHVVADNTVNMTSGKDVTILGSTVTGNSVAMNVGHNLTVESVQDTASYHETTKNKGVSLSMPVGTNGLGLKGSNVTGHIDSDYRSVTEQAGIHSGEAGLSITVGDTTTLKGAVITSTADAHQNRVSTKRLQMDDIQNEASYTAKQSGFSMDTAGLTANGLLGKINPLGLAPVVSIPVSDQANSCTE